MRVRVSGVAVAALVLAGCGAPTVKDISVPAHDESGVTEFDFPSSLLARQTLAPGQASARLELPPLTTPLAFDRIGVSADSIDAGGSAAFEIRVGDAWLPVSGDWSEYVPSTGRTLWVGHLDVPRQPAGAILHARVNLQRGSGSEGELMSPQLTALHLETFAVADIAEGTEAVTPPSTSAISTAATLPAPSIVTRAQWNARPPKCEGSPHSPYRMTFHHTETTNGESGDAAKARMRQMQAFHQDVRGWCDIGYHFSVDAAGQVYQGRDSTDLTASHVGGQNTGNIGVSLMGSFMDVAPPGAQVAGLESIFAYEASKYGITVNADNVRGHQQWPGQTTSCPGTKLLAEKQSILDAVNADLNGGNAGGGTPPAPRATVIVDNTDPGFSVSANWWSSTHQPDHYGANYSVRNVGPISDPALWNATLDGGSYEVFVWYSQGTDRATAAPYFVYSKAGSTKVTVNQQTNGGRWISIGTYDFDAGTSAVVGLSCWTTTGTVVIADAVKLEPR